MNEHTPLTRLPPLLKAKAKVIKCDAVDIETLAIGSVYGNKLRRKVQDLAELRFLLPNRSSRVLRSVTSIDMPRS
jgi:hypothetical protein